ncbi:zinc transport system substrate-binding protein [Glycomyces sambucus]|uniref:Zinc transport system substrate-binding protein n=1 Tax=Glycomyces sambucus TaxID=380244 RepID=A0A1G9E4N6_9ACTN|nr:zinc ABC transporter substrate-binding protein [Glycomyces sambucus]SDK71111.1 zinc transport system substrate-binding protein [Glycomyces sambucus]
MRRSSLLILPIAGLAAASLAACGGEGGSDGDGLNVVAAFYPLAYAAEQVGGDDVTVTNLTPAGQEPHDLELAPSDIAAIEEADYVVYLGDFIPELDAAIEEYASDKALDVATAVDTIGYDSTQALADDHESDHEGDDHAHEEGEESHEEEGEEHAHDDELEGTDPHIWLDPVRYAQIGDAIADGLAGIDEADADRYATAADAFTADLTALDAEFTDGLANRTSDAIVTSHAAFGYLADRYGLTQVAISGLSPDQEPDTQRMAEVAQYVEDNAVTTIFFETLVSPDIAETLAAESGAQTAVLDPLEGLADDKAADGADYFTVMRENLAALQTALGAA